MRGRKTGLTVGLTAAQRRELESMVRATTLRAGLVRRARLILLLADAGITVKEVGQMAGISRRFVYKWAARFQADGVDGLEDKSGSRGRWRRPRSC
jgi:CRP-like cAMP-binding protein